MEQRVFLTKLIGAQLIAFLISYSLNATVFLKGTPIVRADIQKQIAYLPQAVTSRIQQTATTQSTSNPAVIPTGTAFISPTPPLSGGSTQSTIPQISPTASPQSTIQPTSVPTNRPTPRPTQFIPTNPPQQPTSPPPSGATATALEKETVDLINAERAKLGLGALTINSQLTAAARRHAKDMYAHSNYSHTGTDGSDFVRRIRDAGFTGSPYGEVVGWMHSTAASIVQGWMNSPPHRSIIMYPSAKQIGIGWDGNCQAGEIAL